MKVIGFLFISMYCAGSYADFTEEQFDKALKSASEKAYRQGVNDCLKRSDLLGLCNEQTLRVGEYGNYYGAKRRKVSPGIKAYEVSPESYDWGVMQNRPEFDPRMMNVPDNVWDYRMHEYSIQR